MATAKESLRRKVDQLSEDQAQAVLGLIASGVPELAADTNPKVNREVVRARLAGRPAFRVPPVDAPPFRRRKRLQCGGVPASALLIADRR